MNYQLWNCGGKTHMTKESIMSNILHSSKSNEWFTPLRYIEAVEKVFGGIIDLDPASCEEANKIVGADSYFTEKDNGLELGWYGDVFCNPPYGKTGNKSNQGLWLEKAISEMGNCENIIFLCNSQTSEKWFQNVWLHSSAICFTGHRIKFINSEGKKSQPTHGNCFVLFTEFEYIEERFKTEFRRFGEIV